MNSNAETLLAVQLEQAGIPFEREFRFAPPRRWRADVAIYGDEDVPSLKVQVLPPDRVEAIGSVEEFADAIADSIQPTTVRRRSSRPTLLVEIDGGGWVQGHHSRGKGMEDDAEKASAAAILGYRVIRCTPRQVENGTALEWIRQALGLAEVAA